MIKKLIGLILILFLVFILIKSIAFLPSFSNIILGNNKSPFQVGTDYVNGINNAYGNNRQEIKYNTSIRKVLDKVTLEKSFGRLILYIENGNPNIDSYIWLTNTPNINNNTEYINFGQLYKDNSIRQYIIDMKGGDILLSEFKYILIVDKNQNLIESIILN